MRKEIIINTPCGNIKGTSTKIEGIVAFKGIRYATAKRFEYPKEITHWDDIYDASEYGNCSYQPRAFYNEEENLKKIFYYHEFRKGRLFTYSEDCLFLNIWTPSNINDKERLPVLVYIHGGGFTGGCGHEAHFDTPLWPLKGIIGITINYRLGPLGFTCHPDLKKNDGHSGNYGIFDQITALQWIKHNISSFGGDPDNITIMGQSAGAMSVQQLCLSPLTIGLFNKAVMSSGGGINNFLKPPKEETQYSFTNKIIEYCNCTSIDELKEIDIKTLFEGWFKAKKDILGMPSVPVIDNVVIIDSPNNILKQNKHHHIPYLVGSNSEDMVPPFMHSMSKKWCDTQDIPSYCYLFNHKLPGDNNGAWHSSDLWYFFGTLNNSWRPMTKVDYDLSNTMISYLVNFVKTGNPNDNILPIWNASSKNEKSVMHFGNDFVGMKKVNKKILLKNLLFKKSVGE